MRSILIVKIWAIGDVAMSLRMATGLKARYPRSQITWLVGEGAAPLVKATQEVDEVICVSEKRLAGKAKGMEVLRIWALLSFRRFDLILTGHRDARYGLLSRTAFGKERRRYEPRRGFYHGDEYLRMALGEGAEAPLPELRLPELKSPGTEIAMAPGGAKNALRENFLRRWPIEHYRKTIEEVGKERVTLIGGPQDGWVEEALPNVRSLIGRLSLLETVAFLKKTGVLLTHDSGPLHLAKLAGCKTVALFGPTDPAEFVGKRESVTPLALKTQLICQPCYDGKDFPPCPRQRCLEAVTPEEVIRILASQEKGLFAMIERQTKDRE
jgi:heptosyltransferase-2